MASAPAPETLLQPLEGRTRPVGDWVTTFHLVVVALDPFTHESSWILPTARRVLTTFKGANCRVAWLICGNESQVRRFLGPLSEEFLTFLDPERAMVKALALERLPAIVHLNHQLDVVGDAEGWDPKAWRGVTDKLSKMMHWSKVTLPSSDDPGPFPGAPALG